MLSVIVPAYREGSRIASNIGRLTEALDALAMPYEVVVVCDGSPDDTYEQAETCASERVRVFTYTPNMGKGYALKYGFERSAGDPITFIDADMDLHPKEIGIFIKLMEIYDADVVVGSKRHPQSRVKYPPFRRFQSWVYQLLVRILFNLDVSDTQTGLKLFRRKVLEASLPRIIVKKFAFDLELFVIDAICQWCVISALLTVALLVVSVLDLRELSAIDDVLIGDAAQALKRDGFGREIRNTAEVIRQATKAED